MAPTSPELPKAVSRNDFDKPPEGLWCYMADMDFTSVRKMGCVFSLINYQMNKTPIPNFLRPTLLTPKYRTTIIEMLEKAEGNEVLINILRWVSVQSDITGTNPTNKIDMEKGEKLLDAVRELRLSVNHYVKEPMIYKVEYEETKVYWKWMMGKNKKRTGVNCSYICLGERDKNTKFHHGIDEKSPIKEEDMENPKEGKDMFSEVLVKDNRTTCGGRSYGKSFEWEDFNEEAFETTSTTAAKAKPGRKPQMIAPDSDDDDDYSDSVRTSVKTSCNADTKPKSVVRKPRMILKSDSENENPPRTPVKTTASFACVSCATKKSACDKKKPSCTRCSKRSFICTYLPSGPTRGAKKTNLPFRKSSDVANEPTVERESMFPGLVPTKRPTPGTPRVKGKKSRTAGMNDSVGGVEARDEYDANDIGIEDEEMLD